MTDGRREFSRQAYKARVAGHLNETLSSVVEVGMVCCLAFEKDYFTLGSRFEFEPTD
jgi:hypothetical protein